MIRPPPEPARSRPRDPAAPHATTPSVSHVEVPTREIVEQLAATGAIMTRPGSPLIRELVGVLRWADDHTVLWFTAFGENARDAQLVRFDRVEIHPVGACFLRGSSILAFLTSIEKSAVDDVDDYRIAWRLWQELLPLRETAIALVFDSLLEDAATSKPSTMATTPLALAPEMLIDGIPALPAAPLPSLEGRPDLPVTRPTRA